MKHVLIPTDLTIPSLNPVHAAMAFNKDEKLKITLLHLLHVPTDISSLLFAHKRDRYEDKISNAFREACQVLENRFGSQLVSLKVKFAFGSTTAYVKNLLTGERVDSIVYCSDMQLGLPFAQSVNMVPLLRKSGFPVSIVPVNNTYKMISTINMHAGNEIKVPSNKPSYVTEK